MVAEELKNPVGYICARKWYFFAHCVSALAFTEGILQAWEPGVIENYSLNEKLNGNCVAGNRI